MPPPLKNPAGFCFGSCRRQMTCRLGEGEGEEQRKILEAETHRCSRNCIEWIKSHPYDAVAIHHCYSRSSCAAMMSCIGEIRRLLGSSADPEKKRQCFKLCVDYSGCDGNERACIRSCANGDLRIYKALEKCENRGCPAVKECVEKEMKQPALHQDPLQHPTP